MTRFMTYPILPHTQRDFLRDYCDFFIGKTQTGNNKAICGSKLGWKDDTNGEYDSN